MKLSGSIEHIVYRSEETGYTVAVVDVEGKPTTCVGSFPMLSEGEWLEAEGEFTESKYGTQFKVSRFRLKPPDNEDGIARFLASGLIRGVGEATASAIVSRFGKEALDVIEFSPARLAEIRGISERKALEISENFKSVRNVSASVIYLQQYGVTAAMALRIVKVYRERTEELVGKNPYRLIEDVDGIGFLTADRIAQEMGVGRDSDFRLRAGLLHCMQELTQNSGSTFCQESELIRSARSLLDLPAEGFEARCQSQIRQLLLDRKLTAWTEEGEPCVALTLYYKIEKSLAARLLNLEAEFRHPIADCEGEIAHYEKINGIALHEGQKEAVRAALEHGVSVITGGPGTGKTTIVRCVLHLLRENGLKAVLCAPTGRAAKRLAESTGEEAATIHRLLDLDFKDGRGFFTFNEQTRLPADAVIVDEVSMVDCALMNSLASAVRPGRRLILVGDKDQLPSVSPGNVLADIIASGEFSVTQLTHIYRQSATSQIAANAHRINRGEFPLFAGRDSDFLLCEREDPGQILAELESMCCTRIPRYLGTDPTEIQVLAPMKRGLLGVENLNRRLQKLLNPPLTGKAELSEGNQVFRVGDKVMQTVNNYNMEWERPGEGAFTERGSGVFNGDIGLVEEVDQPTGSLTVRFDDGRLCRCSAVHLPDLTLPYAISTHKSQGCEFDAAVIPVTSGPPALFNRNLLYTAVTRAKKLVVLIGSRAAIARMIANNYIEKRNTMLTGLLRSEKEKRKALAGDEDA